MTDLDVALLLVLGILALCAMGLIADRLPESWEHRDARERSVEPRYWRVR